MALKGDYPIQRGVYLSVSGIEATKKVTKLAWARGFPLPEPYLCPDLWGFFSKDQRFIADWFR